MPRPTAVGSLEGRADAAIGIVSDPLDTVLPLGERLKGQNVIREIERRGGVRVRQSGSHVFCRCACGRFTATVPDHGPRDLGKGLVAAIRRQLAGCAAFGEDWL